MADLMNIARQAAKKVCRLQKLSAAKCVDQPDRGTAYHVWEGSQQFTIVISENHEWLEISTGLLSAKEIHAGTNFQGRYLVKQGNTYTDFVFEPTK